MYTCLMTIIQSSSETQGQLIGWSKVHNLAMLEEVTYYYLICLIFNFSVQYIRDMQMDAALAD